MQNRNSIPFALTIRTLALTVFYRKIKNYLCNVKIRRCNCERQGGSEDSVPLHLSGENERKKSVLNGFVFDDLRSKILLNNFKIRSLVKSKRRSELVYQLQSSAV